MPEPLRLVSWLRPFAGAELVPEPCPVQVDVVRPSVARDLARRIVAEAKRQILHSARQILNQLRQARNRVNIPSGSSPGNVIDGTRGLEARRVGKPVDPLTARNG